MSFAPTVQAAADVTEVRGHLRDAAAYLLELRQRPTEARDASHGEDVRSAVDFIHEFDVIARALEQGERGTQTNQGRGPAGAFTDLAEFRSAGAEFTAAAGFDEFSQRGGRGMFEVEVRTLLLSENSDPGAGVFRPVGTPTLQAQTIRQRRLFVRDVMNVSPTGLSSVPYIREVNAASLEGGAAMTSEGSAKAEVSMKFSQQDAPIRKISAWIPATSEILADAPTLRGYIDTRLRYMILLREEAQVLAGDGTAPNLRGLTETSGTQVVGVGTGTVAGDVPATFAAAIGLIENVDGEADGVAMNPLDYWGAIATRYANQRDATYAQDTLSWGLPVVRTRALTQTNAIVGSWRLGAQIFQREGVVIRVGDQHSDYFVLNKVAILGEERVGLAVHRPDFFVETTIDLTA